MLRDLLAPALTGQQRQLWSLGEGSLLVRGWRKDSGPEKGRKSWVELPAPQVELTRVIIRSD